MLLMKKSLALAAAVALAATLGAGCSKKPEEQKPGGVKVSVDTSALIADVGRIQVTIEDAGNAPPISPAIVATLTKAPAGNVWSANVTNIPAAPAPGSVRRFKAEAFQGTTKIYEGSTLASVIAGQTAEVTILLQEIGAPGGPENFAPRLTSISSTSAYVLPGQTGTFAVTAEDPDHLANPGGPFDGTPLSYLWSATCTAGTLAFGTPTAPTTTFTAPSTSATCTVSVRVAETAIAGGNNLSVTTYFTVTVNANFGDADVLAFPNSFPRVTVRGEFFYNFFGDTTIGGVVQTTPGQGANLYFTATDPDGDDVRFDLSARCGPPGAGNQVLIPGSHFSATTLTTAAGGPVAPPTPRTFTFNPTFGYPAPAVSPYTVPSHDCRFEIAVQDLCTAGNCGAGQGSLPNGADKVTLVDGVSVRSVTTGFINATAPQQPRRAPRIVRAVAPNQLGGPAGNQTWDPKNVARVEPSTAYNLQAEAFDEYEAGPLSVAWVCANGTAGTPANQQVSGNPKSLKSDVVWTSPATLTVGMSCTATFTSAASGLGTVVTFEFEGSDPCVGQPNGTACNDGNLCTTGESCQAGVCTVPAGGTTVCTASGQCGAVGVCDPLTGTCSQPNAPNGTACNADSSGCTVGDACVAGTCVAGGSAVCNTPPNSYCYAGAGLCVSTGSTSFSCSYAPATGQSCTAANAAVRCNGADTFSTFACDAAGACVGSGAVACANTDCANGNTCQAATGQCGGGTFASAGTSCSDGDGCTTSDACDGAGNCSLSLPFCPAGSSCNPAGPVCVETGVAPQLAKRLEVNYKGLAQGTDGAVYAAGKLFQPTKVFDGVSLTSAGAGDVFVGKYGPAGVQQWVRNFGDAADQDVSGTAVTADGTVAVVGFFTGALPPSTLNTASPTPVDYLLFLDGATGAQKAGAAGGAVFNNGIAGRLQAINANPTLNLVAVCGYASQASDLVPGAVYGGGTEDVVVALFNASTGARLWSRQIGGTAEERCNALYVDDLGDVYAAGQYDGPLDLGLGALPNPASSVRRHVWVARLNGTTGATLQNAAFGNVAAAGNHNPRTLGKDAAGNLFVAGFFTNTLPIGATSLVSAGAADTFVAKLDAALAPLWAVRMGATGADELRGLAVDSFGNPTVVGLFSTPLGTPTTGFAALTAASNTASDAFAVKLSGATGVVSTTTSGPAAYRFGDGNSQSANAVVVNRAGTGSLRDDVVFAGAFAGGIDFGVAGNLTTTGTDMYVTFAELQ